MIARELCRRSSPDTFHDNRLEDNRNYARLLRKTMDYVNPGGHTVILTPGRYNAAYFEHSYLAEKTGAHLANGSELVVEDDKLYYRAMDGKLECVGAVYRRISDEYLDPMNFNPESLIGIPHIYDVFKKGNVALLNAPGNGVADDKGIYYFVPKMIRYYLGEEPILSNAPTYLPFYEEDMKYVLEHFDDLGETTQRIADGVFRVISEYTYGIQYTSFYMPGEFLPHVRLMATGCGRLSRA